ncbi:MAG: UDPGP type 1 family protein [Kiritimatiellae bacterium]|nr:UDPGP type 1 family protein [Kiritimatiellia bacterium]MDD5520116.1 UDPGP type 1 family protein [Kiritimatiellia bacterium]
MALNFDKAKEILERNGQPHVLRFWDRLDNDQRKALLLQIEGLDFESLIRMKDMLSDNGTKSSKSDIQPAEVIPLSAAKEPKAAGAGEDAIRAGVVGVVLVAGGQGSRLGFEGPKGCYGIAPITNASLFEIHSKKILGLENKYKAKIPFYIMTSLANDKATKDFFVQNNYFGLSEDRVLFFVQGMWPALDKDGKIILDAPGRIFMSPDGHGGILAALRARGIFDDMEKRGLETLFYFQVDNPLVEIAEPAFIGLHRLNKADISVKVCSKRDPDEGIGVVVVKNGRNAVVEYTELTKEQKHARLPDGELKFKYGSVAIHVFSLDFLRKEADATIPLHVAHKKVPYCGNDGKTVKPDKPNAYKFEKFIFDVIPDARCTINVEFAREEEFSPVKNAEGSDSPATTRADMMKKWFRWFELIGISIPRDTKGKPRYRVEIDPCFALVPEDFGKKLGKGFKITGDVLLR